MRRDALDAGVHHEESEILHDEREDNKKTYQVSKSLLTRRPSTYLPGA